jgi:hypothetical protein
MAQKEYLRTYQLTFPSTGIIELPVAGNFIAISESSANFVVTLDDENRLDVRKGISIEKGYSKLRFEGNNTETFTIFVGFGKFAFTDSSQITATLTGTSDTNITAVGGSAPDFASQTTLAALLTELQAKADTAEAQSIVSANESAAGTQLSAPATQAAAGYAAARSKHSVAVTVANIDTSVDYNIQGTLDGSTWFDLESSDIQQTSNGTYHHTYDLPLRDIRLNFTAEAGGAAVTLDSHFLSKD